MTKQAKTEEIQLTASFEQLKNTALFFETSPNGLTVATVSGKDLSTKDIQKIYRFRLLQYFYRGWVSPTTIESKNIVCEPQGSESLTDLHTLVIDSATQILRGYGTLTSPLPVPGEVLGDNSREKYVVERDYDFNLAEHLGSNIPTSSVKEGKRLIRDIGMEWSPAAASVPWWVYLAWAQGCRKVLRTNPGGAIVGDAKEKGAIFQLALLGFNVETLSYDSITPNENDIFAPMWDQEEKSRPFILTDNGELHETLQYLHDILITYNNGSIRSLLKNRKGLK